MGDKNWFLSMLSEGGKISHKRFISVIFALAGVFTVVFVVVKYKEYVVTMYNSTLLFIAVMSGVATVAQIVSLVKGTTPPPDQKPEDVPPAEGEQK